ncbi:MAG: phosphohistidine phosphatase SixA [Desulfuromonadales bacterium]|nr:phosphohistidine phosphatase SixA [Desulfuromonadales bacterium]
MKLYVMRHAEAIEGSDTLQDEWRYLTEKGRAAAKEVSSSIAKLGPKPRLTITSPLTRAVQTAEFVAETACRKNVVVASALLLPGADLSELVAHLKGCKDDKRILLVGHEPQLGSLVAALLGREKDVVSLKKGSCVALELDPKKGDKPAGFLWYLTPGRKCITSFKKAFPQTGN